MIIIQRSAQSPQISGGLKQPFVSLVKVLHSHLHLETTSHVPMVIQWPEWGPSCGCKPPRAKPRWRLEGFLVLISCSIHGEMARLFSDFSKTFVRSTFTIWSQTISSFDHQFISGFSINQLPDPRQTNKPSMERSGSWPLHKSTSPSCGKNVTTKHPLSTWKKQRTIAILNSTFHPKHEFRRRKHLHLCGNGCHNISRVWQNPP